MAKKETDTKRLSLYLRIESKQSDGSHLHFINPDMVYFL